MAFVTIVVEHWLEQQIIQWDHHELFLIPASAPQQNEGRKCFIMHSTHFIYSFVASKILCYTSCRALAVHWDGALRSFGQWPNHWPSRLDIWHQWQTKWKRFLHQWSNRSVLFTARGGSVCSWCDGSILHGGPIEVFQFKPVLHDWCNKGCGMCYPVCRMMHIKRTLVANWKEDPMWWQQVSSLAIWVALYHIVQHHITANKMCWAYR